MKVFIYVRHWIDTGQKHFGWTRWPTEVPSNPSHFVIFFNKNHPQIKPKRSGKRPEKRKAVPSNVHLQYASVQPGKEV